MSTTGSIAANEVTPGFTTKGLITDCVLAILLVLIACFAGEWIKHACREYIPIVKDTEQRHYFSFPEQPQLAGRKLPLWTEIGKNGVTAVRQTSGYKAALEGFQNAVNWPQAVYWSMRASDTASLLVTFPPEQASTVALFMTDGDSRWRISELSSGKQHLIADQLRNGRWLYLAVNPEEARAGSKRILFRKLTGDDIALSAIAIIK